MQLVSFSPLDEILQTGGEKKAFLLGVAAYLKKLNAFASVKKTPNLAEYNVGGVISIVEQLEALAETYITVDGEVNSYLQDEDYIRLLVESWFCYEDCKAEKTQAKLNKYFNEEYDMSGSLPATLGKFLLSLEPAINKIKFEMFKVSHNLLTRYSYYLAHGESAESQTEITQEPTSLESDNIQGLLRSFKTLFKLQRVSRLKIAQKSIELRKSGNELFKVNSSHAAVAKYSEALAYDPKNVALLSNRAAVYQANKQADDAIQDLIKATEIDPTYEAAWTRLGFSYLSVGESLKSVKAYSKAINLAVENKRSDQYINKLGEAYKNAQQRAEFGGVSPEELAQYASTIETINQNLPNDTRPPTGEFQAHQSAQAAQIPQVFPQQAPRTNAEGNTTNAAPARAPQNITDILNQLGDTVLRSETVQGYISNIQNGGNNNGRNSRSGTGEQTQQGQEPNQQQDRSENQNNAGAPPNTQGFPLGIPQALQGTLGSLLSSVMGSGAVVEQGTFSVSIDQNGNPIFSNDTTTPLHPEPRPNNNDNQNINQSSGQNNNQSSNQTNNQTTDRDNSTDDIDPEDFDLD